MTNQEKLAEIADILEMEEEELTPECVLDELETWDSVAVLSVISVMNDKFQYKTVGDLMDAMC